MPRRLDPGPSPHAQSVADRDDRWSVPSSHGPGDLRHGRPYSRGVKRHGHTARQAVLTALIALTLGSGAVAQLPALLGSTPQDRDVWAVNALAWAAVGVTWTVLALRESDSIARS